MQILMEGVFHTFHFDKNEIWQQSSRLHEISVRALLGDCSLLAFEVSGWASIAICNNCHRFTEKSKIRSHFHQVFSLGNVVRVARPKKKIRHSVV